MKLTILLFLIGSVSHAETWDQAKKKALDRCQNEPAYKDNYELQAVCMESQLTAFKKIQAIKNAKKPDDVKDEYEETIKRNQDILKYNQDSMKALQDAIKNAEDSKKQ